MTERCDGQPTRTVARCDTCGSIYVAKISSSGSIWLVGLAECPCGDAAISLLDPSQRGIGE